jgi:predicted nucleotidyltransferase component of viral defense system
MNEESLKSKLKVISREKNQTFNQIWKQFLLERFLARLANSNHQEKFIFKGGLLLAHYISIGRETMDIDFLLTKLNAEETHIKEIILNIINNDLNDGVLFTWDKIEVLAQPHMQYTGFRIFLHSNFGKMKDKVQIDIGVGDLVSPSEKVFFPFEYKGKPIFAGEISLLVYPPESIFSEKLESIISRGSLNSRMKDYHDILLMSREANLLDVIKLKNAIIVTFTNRETKLIFPIKFDDTGLNTLQKFWNNHLRSLGQYKNELNIPDKIDSLINEINQWLLSKKIFSN